MMVIAGSASPELSTRLSRELKCQLVKPEVRRFPDGELYIRVGTEVKGEHVIVVQSTCPPQNENIMELCLLLDAVRELGAGRVTAVVPYLAYARQGRRFKPGEAITIHTVCRMIENSGASDVVIIDAHHEEVTRNFSIPAYNLSAMPLLGRYLNRLKFKDPVVLGADKGASGRAKQVALEMGTDYDHLEKQRISPEKVVMEPKRLNVANRDVVIVDDIISTGGTILEAAKVLRGQGARSIYSACSHALLVRKALQKLRAVGVRRVIATDTVENQTSVVSVAPLIASSIH